MKHEHENSLQTAARWGVNVITGIIVLDLVIRFINSWLNAWWLVLLPAQVYMTKKYGDEEAARIRFISVGFAAIVTSPLWLLVALMVLIGITEPLGVHVNPLIGLSDAEPSTAFMALGLVVFAPWLIMCAIGIPVLLYQILKGDIKLPKIQIGWPTLFICYVMLGFSGCFIICLIEGHPWEYALMGWKLFWIGALYLPFKSLCRKVMKHTAPIGQGICAAVLALLFGYVCSNIVWLPELTYGIMDAASPLCPQSG